VRKPKLPKKRLKPRREKPKKRRQQKQENGQPTSPSLSTFAQLTAREMLLSPD
jgi:hypothetical protein